MTGMLNHNTTQHNLHLQMTVFYSNAPSHIFCIKNQLSAAYKRNVGQWQTKLSNDISFPTVQLRNEQPHDKTNKMTVRPVKTQTSLGIRPVSSVFAMRSMTQGFFMQTAMPRLIWVFAGCTCHFVGFVLRRLKPMLQILDVIQSEIVLDFHIP